MQVQNKRELFHLLGRYRNEMRSFGVKRCGVFGSFVRDQQDAQSDVDLIVEFEPGQKSFDNFMQLGFFLEDNLGRKVELVTPESLSPHIGPRILCEVEYDSIGS